MDRLNELDERELVKLAQAGEREAFRVLFERHKRRAFHVAFAVLRSKEDAEDVVQEAFVKAYLSLPDFRADATFFTWLQRIVYNLSIDHKRRFNRRGGTHSEVNEETLDSAKQLGVGVTAAPAARPDELVLQKEQLEAVGRVMDQLSDEHRVAITLREFDGLSYEEISESLGLPVGTVMSRLHYARKKLQEGLKGVFVHRR